MNRFGIELFLSGENLFMKPTGKRKIFRITSEKGHRHVGVTVIKAGAKELALAANGTVKGPIGSFLSDLGDALVFDEKICVAFHFTVFKKNRNSFKKCFHACVIL